MVAKKNPSLLVVSLDVQTTSNPLSIAHQKDLRSLASNLAKLVERYRIPATWAVNDPGDDLCRCLVESTSDEHEIAIHGKSVWPEGRPERSKIVNDLERRMDRAYKNDVSVNAIVGVAIDQSNTDLLVKNQITALRTRDGSRKGHFVEPNAIRFGVWDLPASCHFPGPKTWLSDVTQHKYQRLVRSAAARRKIVHMVIDVNDLLVATSNRLRTLEGVFSCANEYRDAGQLEIANLQNSIKSCVGRPALSPSKSILRAA